MIAGWTEHLHPAHVDQADVRADDAVEAGSVLRGGPQAIDVDAREEGAVPGLLRGDGRGAGGRFRARAGIVNQPARVIHPVVEPGHPGRRDRLAMPREPGRRSRRRLPLDDALPVVVHGPVAPFLVVFLPLLHAGEPRRELTILVRRERRDFERDGGRRRGGAGASCWAAADVVRPNNSEQKTPATLRMVTSGGRRDPSGSSSAVGADDSRIPG